MAVQTGPCSPEKAQRLIDQDKVSVIFGCWTSASRKSVKPVVEARDHLLIYPMAYEGLEQSPNIVYTGAAPNQQVIPAVSWCYESLKARKFFLVGSDYVWPHCVNEIIKDQLKALGATCAWRVLHSLWQYGRRRCRGVRSRRRALT